MPQKIGEIKISWHRMWNRATESRDNSGKCGMGEEGVPQKMEEIKIAWYRMWNCATESRDNSGKCGMVRRRCATENGRNQNIVARDMESCHGKPEEQLEMWYNNYVCVKVEGRLQIEYWLQLL